MSDMVTGNFTEQQINEGKPLAAVGYVPLCCLPLFLVPMLAAKENPYAQYHARQGAILYIVAIAGGIAMGIFAFVTGIIGHGVQCIGSIAELGYGAAVFVVMILGIVNALQGQAKELPVIGQFAAKLPF
ncbi:MAG TPA: hypothetical protein VMV18_07380 [bacterium]|nr:hypothetical protein [bacterium]